MKIESRHHNWLLVIFLLGTSVFGQAQISFSSGARQIRTGQNGSGIFSSTNGDFNHTLQNYVSNGIGPVAIESAVQNSSITNYGDGTGVFKGDAEARITLLDPSWTGASAVSTLAINFTVSNTVSFSFKSTQTGNATNLFSGPGILLGGTTNTAGTLSAGTYQIFANCSTSPTNDSASWQFELDVESSVKSLGCACPEQSPYVTDPIRIGTGNMYHEALDYASSGPNSLAFVRFYNSQGILNTPATTLGKNWRSTYDRYLGGGYPIIAERATGQRINFFLNGGVWVSDSDISIKLTSSGSTWTFVDNDDTIETYQVSGNIALLTSIQKPNGYTQNLTYDGNNHLISVSDSFGRMLQMTYAGNLLATVTCPNGLVLSYAYDSSSGSGAPDRLQSAGFSTSPTTSQQYLYENSNVPFQLTGIVDEKGNRFSTWAYDSTGRGIMNEHAGGADLATIFYNDNDNSRTLTNALGGLMRYEFSYRQNMPKLTRMTRLATTNVPVASILQTYNPSGYIQGRSDWKTNFTTFVSESRGLPTQAVEALATPLVRVTTNLWHTNFHLPLVTAAPRLTTTFQYDTNGNMLARTETDTSTEFLPYPTSGQTRTWTNTYGNYGLLRTATGPRTDVVSTTSYAYDTNGNLVSLTTPQGYTTLFTNYNGSGLPGKIIDPNGVVTLLTYDLRDRLASRTILTSSGNASNAFVYDAAGLLIATVEPDGVSHYSFYDAAHRLVGKSNSLGESVTYTLDAAGNTTQEDIRNAGNAVTKTHRKAFDALSRLIRDVGGSGQTNSYAYDPTGNRLSLTNGLNQRTTQTFDQLNRLTSATDPLLNTTSYGYDPQDNLKSVTDGRFLVTSYFYDGFRQLIQQSSPDSGARTFTLDKAGNRISETDARGIVVLRTFDKQDRVTAETYPASPGENITYSYDASTNENFGIGHLAGYTDESGSTSIRYNELGDVTRVVRHINGTPYTNTYTYNLASRMTGATYPSGTALIYGRDSQGRINSISCRPAGAAGYSTLLSGISYLPFGPISGWQYGNGLVRSFVYDLDYRLTNLITGSGTTVQSLSYAYDLADNITAIADNLTPTLSQGFAYDPAQRLTNAAGIYGTVQYTYDADGNRLSRIAGGVAESYSYSPMANQLQSILRNGNTRTFGYTLAGNTSNDDRGGAGALNFIYGNRNRLGSVTSGASTVATYKYAARGERVSKTVGSTTTHFHYDLARHLVAESAASGAVIREYIWFNDTPIAQIEPGGRIYFIHPDHLNTPQKLTDNSRTVVWDRKQQPFGETVSLSSSGNSGEPSLSASLNQNTHEFQVTVSGPANVNFTLQRAGSLVNPSWTVIDSGTAPFTHNDSVVNTGARFYRAYGNGSPVTHNLRFPGQYFDAETGLNYNMMRDYDPTSGRYIQSDPWGLFSGVNLYGYSRSNPNTFVDPNGTNPGLFGLDGQNPLNYPGLGNAIAAQSADAAAAAVQAKINEYMTRANGDIAKAWKLSDDHRSHCGDNSAVEADANHYLGYRMVSENLGMVGVMMDAVTIPVYQGAKMFPGVTSILGGSPASVDQFGWGIRGMIDGWLAAPEE